MIVVKKLGKGEELLSEKLVREVNGCVHNARAVRPDRVGNVADVDRVQELIVGHSLHEDLVVKVIEVPAPSAAPRQHFHKTRPSDG